MKKFAIPLFAALIALSGCDGNERLEEKAKIEGTAGANAELNAQNTNLMQKAKEMEDDLATRDRFYQAAQGTYEGVLKTDEGKFKIKITLVSSLPPYAVPRTRQLEEISSDLNNLYFNAQVVQWNTANKLSAVGCRIENVRPDILSGTIAIASENCPNFYSLKIADQGVVQDLENGMALRTDGQESVVLASSIRMGRADKVAALRGEMHPTTNATVYEFLVKKTEK